MPVLSKTGILLFTLFIVDVLKQMGYFCQPQSMGDNNKYEIVIGLEVHAQLMTKSKLFCGDSIAFGAEPNMHVSPITLGHPGTLPKMNNKAIEYAIKIGLACNCEIVKDNYFV